MKVFATIIAIVMAMLLCVVEGHGPRHDMADLHFKVTEPCLVSCILDNRGHYDLIAKRRKDVCKHNLRDYLGWVQNELAPCAKIRCAVLGEQGSFAVANKVQKWSEDFCSLPPGALAPPQAM
ncbi:hypothetical protein K491DRAFT_673775 [Lophiostoma macrostomum CBS 122681]|uniref:Uncharacterized protein n=1 Tax=Lophiostoma macrostomum CBS 122681 TaxID=1314788 RepID=A0A6A6TQJ9_9PLEO|nr:hypothetical protein K491DRAFT_673775 [Lophiostoma macrostomum CBS 122681]